MTEIVTKETMISEGIPGRDVSIQAEKSQTVEYVIYFILGLIEILLAFRLLLKLTGANPTSGFVNLIYSLTQMIITPFVGIFPQATSPGAVTTAVFEPATLVAIIVYAVLAWGIAQLVIILSRKLQ